MKKVNHYHLKNGEEARLLLWTLVDDPKRALAARYLEIQYGEDTQDSPSHEAKC
jgi:hypothetical protein